MKKIKHIYKSICILLCIGVMGCNNFEYINTNPNAITTSNATMQATMVILDNFRFVGDARAFLTLNALSKYIGFVNESRMAYQYNGITRTVFTSMTILPNIERMVHYAEGTAMEYSYRGLAKFSRAFMFYHLTMRVGDIPFSEAGQGLAGNRTPRFDPQRDVLIEILDELRQADAYFARGVRFTGDPTPFNGDPDRWRRASNAFALRVLMSMSKHEADPTLRIRERFAEIVNGGYLMEENTGFLGLQFTAINRHPLSASLLFASNTIISSLLVDELQRLNDRRLFYIAEPARQRLHDGYYASDFAAFVGADVSRSYGVLTAEFLEGRFSVLNLRYIEELATEPRKKVTFAEQQLILAEARIRGWITTGSAENFYQEGVRAALRDKMNLNPTFAHGMPITQEFIDNYFTGAAAFAATAEEQLRQIWMQRWIRNFMQDPLTSFFEYRRTRFPEFPINPDTNENVNAPNAIPMRWMYPMSEVNFNYANLVEALRRQFGGVSDDINQLMWVLRAPN